MDRQENKRRRVLQIWEWRRGLWDWEWRRRMAIAYVICLVAYWLILRRRPQRRQVTYSIWKPLIEQTQNVASEILKNKTPQQKSSNTNCDLQLILDCLTDGNSNLSQNSSCPAIQATDKVVVQPHLDFRERRERELKFTAASWKRDCQGKWFRDENVEFDSDEDDPNVCLG